VNQDLSMSFEHPNIEVQSTSSKHLHFFKGINLWDIRKTSKAEVVFRSHCIRSR